MSFRSDLQGNILRGYASHEHAGYVFAAVTEPGAARRLLGDLVPRIRTEEHWDDRPTSCLNVAFTAPGLQRLGVAMTPFADYGDFRQGMSARARAALGDLGANDPDRWTPELADGAHLLFTLYGDHCDIRDREVRALREELSAGGMETVWVQTADALADTREHFGFSDGFSQPAVAGASRDRRPARAEGMQRRAWWRLLGDQWRPIRLGEFVLGHEDEDRVVPGEDHPLLANATFMVWRKLAQHVEVFDGWVREQAGPDPAAQELLAARIVGRWRDGDSLIRRPPSGRSRGSRRGGAQAVPPSEASQTNDFVYGDDPAGLQCPLGAHVRRSYPRDALGFRTERSRRNRIIRRGMPYTDASERGLIFVGFNASISRQFEQIQGNWLMQGDAFGLGADRDFLIGGLHREGDTERMLIPGDRHDPPAIVTRDRQFVTVRGGYYLFVPGMKALRAIADGRA